MILSLKIDGLSQTTHSKMMRANLECSNQSANCITNKQRKKNKQTTQNICCNRFEVNYTWLNRQLKWTSFIWIVFVWPKFINMKKWLFLSTLHTGKWHIWGFDLYDLTVPEYLIANWLMTILNGHSYVLFCLHLKKTFSWWCSCLNDR